MKSIINRVKLMENYTLRESIYNYKGKNNKTIVNYNNGIRNLCKQISSKKIKPVIRISGRMAGKNSHKFESYIKDS